MAKKEMNTRERFRAVMHFQEPDRLPFIEYVGIDPAAYLRWHKEGLPTIWDITPFGPNNPTPTMYASHNLFVAGDYEMDYASYFGIEPVGVSFGEVLPIDLGPIPRFVGEVVEEDDRYRIIKDEGGGVQKVLRRTPSSYGMPMYIDFVVHDQEDWQRVKKRYDPHDPRRYPLAWDTDELIEYYQRIERPVGLIITGFYAIGRHLMGTKNFSPLFYRDPMLAHDIMDFWANFLVESLRRGVETLKSSIDYIYWHEDMSHKGGPIISPKVFREFMLPGYKKVTDFLKSNEVDVINMDSDGDIRLLIPLWVEGGITGSGPLECTPGLDIHDLKKEYPEVGWIGNIDKRALVKGKDAIKQEVEYKVAFMKEAGGCIPCIDHVVPPDVPFENYRFYCDYIKKFL
jgi:uroporphyrinogen decarboxylase